MLLTGYGKVDDGQIYAIGCETFDIHIRKDLTDDILSHLFSGHSTEESEPLLTQLQLLASATPGAGLLTIKWRSPLMTINMYRLCSIYIFTHLQFCSLLTFYALDEPILAQMTKKQKKRAAFFAFL